jgi:hypothetical protein
VKEFTVSDKTTQLDYNWRFETTTTTELQWGNANKPLDRKEYEEDLKRRQKEHLDGIMGKNDWQPCMHDGCPECLGTGIRKNGSMCVHMLSCPCPKCSPRF